MSRKILKDALEALPPKAPEAMKTLLSELHATLEGDDLSLFDHRLLADIAVSHWELARQHSKGEPSLRIYCPLKRPEAQSKIIIDIVSDDMAFLIDSITAAINKHKLLIDLLIHPRVYVKYDKNGKLADVRKTAKDKYLRQSHIHIHIKETLTDSEIEKLEEGLYTTLNDVYLANRDWKKMLAKLDGARNDLANARTRLPAREMDQYCSFLQYLYDNNFTLLGYREYEFVEKKGAIASKILKKENLGLLDDIERPAYINESSESLPRNLQELRRGLPPVSVSKTNRVSSVHRSVPMDAIAVKTYDKDGRVKGEKLFLGLFTSVTYSRSVSDVPLLRDKIDEVLELSDYEIGSHDRRALRHILEKYPRDELFQISPDELLQTCKSILRLQERQRIALFMRRDPFGRYISCLVYVPRDHFGTALREKMAAILEEELDGECTSFTTTLDDAVFARVMMTIHIKKSAAPNFNPEQIEARLQEAGKTWQEKLSEAIAQHYDDEKAITDTTLEYCDAFPAPYTLRYSAETAVFDIEKIKESEERSRLALDLFRPENIGLQNLRLKVYNRDAPLNLSDVMPILENMGLRAISELPFDVKPGRNVRRIWIHDFLLETPTTDDFILIRDVKENFEIAFRRIWSGAMENDSLNRLVLSAKMNWREIVILRAYVHYMKQIRSPFSRAYIEKALTDNPKISRMLVDLFKAFFNPANGDDAESYAAGCAIGIDHELEKVDSLDQDRILRTITGLIEASLRTNFFQCAEDGDCKPYLSIKLDCSKIEDMPAPRPYREIFVYSPRVEGVHLRGGEIARGGLRWSDRHEDFRTEVLGLMKAQMVKNSVIVPMGAKGGFVVKSAEAMDSKSYRDEGIECYKTFIRGLLDITDNRKGDKIIPPENVARRDDDDPYLVVAADKGTATFSDIANGISAEYDFWLGDAFASGGSAGYDHKVMGITARGAWESVKLHFRQLNHNTQTQDFDVIGIGDMSGDVFGNGMLCSEHIRLIGAFNHLHIFCDPDPDTAASYKERKRLFDEVKGWDAYDTKKLSKGGRIYSRHHKLLELTPEIKKRFDIKEDKITPQDLIRIMLKARTDLLWFGGIGTYIKASKESHADVGDKANDAVRVNAKDLRAKVIGEGANLAITQHGRIEYAETGGRSNTDFIDNSGGVDSSDHEVNIKILLSEIMRKKKNNMDTKARNKLLADMTDEIAEHVLRNNYQQAQAVSLAEIQSRDNLQLQEEFIQDLEREKGLSREIEGLPDTENIENRARAGKGLSRPELSILISYAKINFTQDLLACDVPDSKEMQEWLIDYFPEVLQQKYMTDIKNHRLRREIIATMMANSLINRMGPTFLKSRMKKTGASCSDIAKAYILVRDAFELRELWQSIEALDNKVPAEVQLKAMKEVIKLIEHAITWFLTRLGREIDLSKDLQNYSEPIKELRKAADKLVTPQLQENINQRIRAEQQSGLPEDLARQIGIMPVLYSACDIIRTSIEKKTDLLATARTYFEMGEEFHLDWLRSQAQYLPSKNHWQAEANAGLVDQLYSCQAGLTVRVLQDTNGEGSEDKSATKLWLESHETSLRQTRAMLEELRRSGTIDLSMLIIAEQRLRNLYGG